VIKRRKNKYIEKSEGRKRTRERKVTGRGRGSVCEHIRSMSPVKLYLRQRE
jgi:hypothetical protein